MSTEARQDPGDDRFPFWFYVPTRSVRPWWRCEHPERPLDAATAWHYSGCHGCLVAVEALRRQRPDDRHVTGLRRRFQVSTE